MKQRLRNDSDSVNADGSVSMASSVSKRRTAPPPICLILITILASSSRTAYNSFSLLPIASAFTPAILTRHYNSLRVPETSGLMDPATASTYLTPLATRILSSSSSSSTTALFGIPKMFRWLTDQYPDVLNRQLEEGLSRDVAVDNFYLDMNGIIHPCTHGNAEGEIVVLDETVMFKKIFLYVDRYVTDKIICIYVLEG
jgi:hypothetical protein